MDVIARSRTPFDENIFDPTSIIETSNTVYRLSIASNRVSRSAI